MFLDMSDGLEEWSLPYSVKTVSKVTVNFVPTNKVAARTVQAVVQPAQKNKLNTSQVDWSKRYLMVHTSEPLANGELLEYQGEDYKIIDNGDYQLYGFTEAVAEQTKTSLVMVTP